MGCHFYKGNCLVPNVVIRSFCSVACPRTNIEQALERIKKEIDELGR